MLYDNINTKISVRSDCDIADCSSSIFKLIYRQYFPSGGKVNYEQYNFTNSLYIKELIQWQDYLDKENSHRGHISIN